MHRKNTHRASTPMAAISQSVREVNAGSSSALDRMAVGAGNRPHESHPMRFLGSGWIRKIRPNAPVIVGSHFFACDEVVCSLHQRNAMLDGDIAPSKFPLADCTFCHSKNSTEPFQAQAKVLGGFVDRVKVCAHWISKLLTISRKYRTTTPQKSRTSIPA